MAETFDSNNLDLNFYDSHNLSRHESAVIEIPEEGLTPSNLLEYGNQVLAIEGKQIYRESGDLLTKELIASLQDGDNLFIHDDQYPHGQLFEKPINVAIVGPGAVGKSAITSRLISNLFLEDYDPTIEDLFEKRMVIDGYHFTLNILDTAGQEDFSGLRAGQMRDKDGYILVYSVTNRGTFDELQSFFDTLMDVLDLEDSDMKPMILCGNKSDLVKYRKISTTEGCCRARQWQATRHYDTSALNGTNVRNMLAYLMRDIINNLYPVADPELPRSRRGSPCSEDDGSFGDCCAIM